MRKSVFRPILGAALCASLANCAIAYESHEPLFWPGLALAAILIAGALIERSNSHHNRSMHQANQSPLAQSGEREPGS